MLDTTNCKAVSPECPVAATTYGYTPNLGANAFFAAVFGLCCILNLVIGIKSRQVMFTIALTVGSLLELIGYIGRIQMHNNPWDMGGFQMQIVCLILAPSFVAAGIYWSLKHIVLFVGPEKSRLPPRLYPWIFVGCDVGSIILQAAGGGVAGSAKRTNKALLDAGNNIMISGIAFQVATMGVCGVLGMDFVFRVRKGRQFQEVQAEKLEESEVRKFYFFCVGEIIAYLTVLIRCIYRLPEMAGGWGNPLMQKETEFLILDGAMITIAVVILTILHPYFTCPFVRK
ncbi:RTA1 domain protein [Penicillium cataractarum]|uniref:RTA1 domain protein n=1 Tax=Penicillium cataractarum TaxID=2100454 RepID=A0A9W9VTU0_9EURO|nr:RTA1 domain protein [Penicillium cataractarum]KAJ5389246.1 RTA1 domain protein [Penicillium cataractarum]